MNHNPSVLSKLEPSRETQVREQMNRLEMAIAQAADVRNRVEERIITVLRPGAGDLVEGLGEDKAAQIAPLAQELVRLTALVNTIVSMDKDMLERVEL
mgnify:CR=1 FL=1